MFAKLNFASRPRWQLTLSIMFFAQLLSAVGFSIIFPFLPLYVEELGTNTNLSLEFWSGMVFSAQGITMMITAPIWGVVADRYGRKLMVLRAAFGGGVILLLMAFVGSAEELVLLRAIQGLITGTVAASNALVAAVVPRERVGFAMGSLQVGLWGGLAVGPLIGGILADMYGFGMPFIVTAILLFASGFVILFGIDKDEPPPKTAKKTSFIENWKIVLHNANIRLVYLFRFMNGLGRVMIVPIAPLFIVSLSPEGTSAQSTYAGLMVAIVSATSTFSAVYLGRLGDRIGHRQTLIASALLATLFYIPQTFVTEVWQLLILQAFTGIALGGVIAAPSALLAVFSEYGNEGAVYGLDNSVIAASRAVAPLAGSFIAVWFGMRSIFAITGIIFLFVALFAFWQLPQGIVTSPQVKGKVS